MTKVENMENIKNVLVIGLGLIGGSIALGIKRDHPDVVVSGFDLSRTSLERGIEMGAIDIISDDISTSASVADVIFLCTPVRTSERFITDLSNVPLKKNVIVTDVGSTKSEIVEFAHVLREKGITFVGGHPMAGSHKSGMIAANANLFENAYYLFTPKNSSENNAVDTLKKLLSGTHANFLTLSPDEHDKVVGTLSHIPHIIASGLVRQADDLSKELPNSDRLAAGGFRDITRIASSDPQMWTDILISNKDILGGQLKEWQALISEVIEWLDTKDEESIFKYFENSKNFRDALPASVSAGAIPAFCDLFVTIPDYPGSIAEVTTYLAKDGISLTNFAILETREDINGILQLSFGSKSDQKRARECIERNSDYICHER